MYCSFYSWYFGKITREESETILQNHHPGSFLVRNSETVQKAGAYTVSLRSVAFQSCDCIMCMFDITVRIVVSNG